MRSVCGPLALMSLFVVAAPDHALAQDSASLPKKTWNLDIAGTAGISPGIGAATTGLDVSAAVAVVRSTESGDFGHRCFGLTTMFTGLWARSEPGTAGARERSVLVGPRWDAGDLDGMAFVRVLGGVRQLSGPSPTPNGQPESSDTTVAVGAGLGVAVLGVLVDLNWVMSPWFEGSSQRVTVGIGYVWSPRR